MKKLYLSILAVLFCTSLTFGQATIFQDNFDSYVAGTALTLQNPVDWMTWSGGSGTAEDPLVSSAVAFSGANSVLLTSSPGPRDVVHHMGDLTTGKYRMRFRMYIPAGFDGYFNTLQDFAGTTSLWGMQVYFYAGGTGNMDAGGALVQAFTFAHDTWLSVEVMVDINANWAEVWLNGTMLHAWQWSLGAFGAGQINELDGNNFFGHDDVSTTGPGMWYLDDYVFEDLLIPVELTSFTAAANSGYVQLNWSTATETNNQMFEIQRQSSGSEFITIGFVNGHGTTTETQEYNYVDRTVSTGTYSYRLKQIDFDGTYEYSDVVEVDVQAPLEFALDQNYPNPFNPTTNIKFGVPESGFAKLSVYNIVGEEVAILVNGIIEAGVYDITFDARNLPSGAYFYKLQSEKSVEVKKMLLTK